MGKSFLTAAGGVLVLCLAAVLLPVSVAQEVIPECTETDACEDDEFTVQIGGMGSNSSEPDNRLSDGEIATADLTYTYDGDMDTLTVRVVNDTYTATGNTWDAVLQSYYFNMTGNISDLNLTGVSYPPDCDTNENVDEGATPDPDADSSAGGWNLCASERANGFGTFDWRVTTTDCGQSGGNTGLISDATGDGCAEFTFDVTPSGVSACDFNSSSVPPPEDRLTNFVAKFQDATNGGSGFVSPCGEDLLVELASFETVPSDGHVTVEFETAIEIDNQGFYIWRADLVKGEVQRVSEFIPAVATNNNGASYSFTDSTAVNGVEHTYFLEDIDLFNVHSFHAAKGAIANPQGPEILTLAPAYGATVAGSAPLTVSFDGEGFGFAVLFSADPSFEDRRNILAVRSGRSGDVTLNRGQMRRLNRVAASSEGVVYWRVVEARLSSVARYSQTWRLQITGPDVEGRK